MTFLRLLIAAPFLLILVLFALSNTAATRLTMWPTDFALEMPLSLTILAAMALGFLLGGMMVWFTELGQRRRARRAEANVRQLEAQVADLKAQLPVTASVPGATGRSAARRNATAALARPAGTDLALPGSAVR